MGKDGPTIQPLTLVYLVSGRFILRLGKSSNLSDLRPYWNMAYDAQDGKYKNNAERRSGAGRMMSFRRPRWKSARSDR